MTMVTLVMLWAVSSPQTKVHPGRKCQITLAQQLRKQTHSWLFTAALGGRQPRWPLPPHRIPFRRRRSEAKRSEGHVWLISHRARTHPSCSSLPGFCRRCTMDSTHPFTVQSLAVPAALLSTPWLALGRAGLHASTRLSSLIRLQVACYYG